jgi:hypothetical protein
MKKLAVLLMIPALAMFMVPSLASADWYYLWGVQGDYAMLATGSCLHSTSGFSKGDDGTYRPNPKNSDGTNATVWGGSFIAEGIWTFNGDGTGKAAVTSFVIVPPPSPDPRVSTTKTPPGDAPTFPFTYEVARDGKITLHASDIGLPLLEGWVSMNLGHQTMTLRSANQIQNPGVPTICDTGRILIRVDK